MLLGGYSDFLEHCQVGITSGFHSLTSNVKTCVPNMPISYISGCAGLLQHHVGHAHRCDAECRGRESWDQDEPDRRGAASSESYQAPSHMDQQVGWLEKKNSKPKEKRNLWEGPMQFSQTFPVLSTRPATSWSQIWSLLSCSPTFLQSASTYWTWAGMRRNCGNWGWRRRTWHYICSIRYKIFNLFSSHSLLLTSS